MLPVTSDFFEFEKNLLKESRELIKSKNYDEKQLIDSFSILVEQFDKMIRDAEKIIRISDSQQEYLHRVQTDLKKEIEDRIRAEEKLKYLAAIDALTGCYTRGMGLTFLENELKAIHRNNSIFSICYIDVNGLKYVNDNFGHFEGDELLVLVCKFIKDVIKDSDILCRLGGDEFLIIFPNSSQEIAAENLQKITSNMDAKNMDKIKPYNISFSHGIFEIKPNDNLDIDEIIQKADAKMYEHKKSIKNCIET